MDTIYSSKQHEDFYNEHLLKCRQQEVYHKALIYTLGIDRNTRENIDSIYDFNTGCVKTECLHQGWITSGSARIVRMAFNLYCNATPSVIDYEDDPDATLNEAQRYSAQELFFCDNAKYFWEAIKIRYPEFCQ